MFHQEQCKAINFTNHLYQPCLPRGGNAEKAVPPCAIIVKAQGSNSIAEAERFVMRWSTVTCVADIRRNLSIRSSHPPRISLM